MDALNNMNSLKNLLHIPACIIGAGIGCLSVFIGIPIAVFFIWQSLGGPWSLLGPLLRLIS